MTKMRMSDITIKVKDNKWENRQLFALVMFASAIILIFIK